MATDKNCEGVTRRDCLRLGLSGLIAGGLVGALKARAASPTPSLPRQADADRKSVV